MLVASHFLLLPFCFLLLATCYLLPALTSILEGSLIMKDYSYLSSASLTLSGAGDELSKNTVRYSWDISSAPGGWINVLIRITSALFEVEIDVAFRPGLATFNQIIWMKEKVKLLRWYCQTALLCFIPGKWK